MANFAYIIFTTFLAATLLSSTSAQTTHIVGDSLGWTVPPGGAIAYSTWAATKTFTVGDILEFNFTSGAHDVVEVTKAGFDACNGSNSIGSLLTTSPANITVSSAGTHYYICTFTQHCALGQKLAINVTAASSPAPATAPSPSSSTTRSPVTYTVGDSLGWTVPPGGPIAYQTWASNKTFFVGDILVFNFTNGQHDVAEVTKSGFDSCNGTSTIGSVLTNSPATITLQSNGSHYYICTFTQHCPLGQKLAINVTGTAGSATPPSSTATPPSSTPTPSPSSTTPPPSPSPSTANPPSSTTPPPSSTTTPPPSTATPPSGISPSGNAPSGNAPPPPPPPNAAQPLVAGVSVSLTLFSIAIAFLYY